MYRGLLQERTGTERRTFELAHKGTLFGRNRRDFTAAAGETTAGSSEREIMEVGEILIIPVDIRIPGGTNQNLSSWRLSVQFREDFIVPPGCAADQYSLS